MRLPPRILTLIVICAAAAAGVWFAIRKQSADPGASEAVAAAMQYVPPGAPAGASPPELLTDAITRHRTLPAYRIHSRRSLPSGATATVDKLVLNREGQVLQRTTLSVTREDRKRRRPAPPAVYVESAEGEWRLFPGAAIKTPSRAERIAAAEQFVIEHAPKGAPADPLQYWVEYPAGASDAGTVVIREIAPATTLAQRLRVAQAAIDQKRQMKERGAEKLSAAAFVPARTEFWIEENSRRLTRKRIVSAQGTVMLDHTYTPAEGAISEDAFAIPPGLTLLFPQTDHEYSELVLQYSQATAGSQKPNKTTT